MYDTILVPTDGSDHAIRAAEHGLTVARAFDATVHALNVIDLRAAGGPFDAGGLGAEFLARLEQQGESAVGDIEGLAHERGIDGIQTAVIRGHPSEAIREYANEHDADLLAMGTQGTGGVKRYITGSVTERVVRSAGRPVLTVRDTDRSRSSEGYDEILVPTDGSEFATAAAEHAVAIARQYGARIHAVNVVDVPSLASTPTYTPPGDLVAALEQQGKAATDEIVTDARNAGLDGTADVREGSPSETLLEYAGEFDVDLIVMGTAGRTGLDRYLLGSTTERTIRDADVPVLAVNAGNRTGQ